MDLHSLYCVEFPDDALAPRYPRGTRAFFRPASHADDQSVVIVEYGGRHHVRYLRRWHGGQEAAAVNAAYRPLHEYRLEGVMVLVQASTIYSSDYSS
jgi:Peptidase S24-like